MVPTFAPALIWASPEASSSTSVCETDGAISWFTLYAGATTVSVWYTPFSEVKLTLLPIRTSEDGLVAGAQPSAPVQPGAPAEFAVWGVVPAVAMPATSPMDPAATML